MDLNYLFYRQQIERSLAKSASSEPVRKVHEGLAAGYEERINRAAATAKRDAEGPPLIHRHAPAAGIASRPAVNATLAVAITAREVDDADRD